LPSTRADRRISAARYAWRFADLGLVAAGLILCLDDLIRGIFIPGSQTRAFAGLGINAIKASLRSRAG